MTGAAPGAADGDAVGGVPALGQCPWGRQEQTARGQSTGAERGPERVGVRKHPEMAPGLRLTAAGGGRIHRESAWPASHPGLALLCDIGPSPG